LENRDEERSRFRTEALSRRAQTPATECEELSTALVQHIPSSQFLGGPSVLAGFWAIRGEPRINPALESLREQGVRVVFPVIEGALLEFREVESFELSDNRRGVWGIPEPRGAVFAPEQIDLFLVPGLVFDKRGGRLGYGKGYYDRVLSKAREDSQRIGIAFRRDIVEVLPTYEHDIRMHGLISESGDVLCRDEASQESGLTEDGLDP